MTNCSNNLFGDFSCNGPNTGNIVGTVTADPFLPGTTLTKVNQVMYYVADSTQDDSAGVPYPALYRNDEELAQGVENILAYFGYDSDDDGVANQYLTTANVGANDWGDIVTVRLEITFRSLEKVGNVGDGYARRVMIKTVQVRNRMQGV